MAWKIWAFVVKNKDDNHWTPRGPFSYRLEAADVVGKEHPYLRYIKTGVGGWIKHNFQNTPNPHYKETKSSVVDSCTKVDVPMMIRSTVALQVALLEYEDESFGRNELSKTIHLIIDKIKIDFDSLEKEYEDEDNKHNK